MTSRPHAPLFSTTIAVLLGFGLAVGCGDKQAADPSDDEAADGSDENPPAEETADGEDDGEDDGEASSDDGTFVSLPDGGAVNTCDPAEQDCPDGEKCTGYVVEQGACCVDANKCVPVIGNQQLNDPCERSEDNDDCDVGLFCMTKTSGSTGAGVCRAFCHVGDQDCAEDGLPDATCFSFNDGTLPLCQEACDPILQDCADNLGCYGVGTQGFVCSVPGFDDGLGADGDMCYTIQSCQPGLGCTAGEALSDCNASRCCSPYCDLDAPDPCAAPEVCTPYYEEGAAPPNYAHVGVCAIPA